MRGMLRSKIRQVKSWRLFSLEVNSLFVGIQIIKKKISLSFSRSNRWILLRSVPFSIIHNPEINRQKNSAKNHRGKGKGLRYDNLLSLIKVSRRGFRFSLKYEAVYVGSDALELWRCENDVVVINTSWLSSGKTKAWNEKSRLVCESNQYTGAVLHKPN